LLADRLHFQTLPKNLLDASFSFCSTSTVADCESGKRPSGLCFFSPERLSLGFQMNCRRWGNMAGCERGRHGESGFRDSDLLCSEADRQPDQHQRHGAILGRNRDERPATVLARPEI